MEGEQRPTLTTYLKNMEWRFKRIKTTYRFLETVHLISYIWEQHFLYNSAMKVKEKNNNKKINKDQLKLMKTFFIA